MLTTRNTGKIIQITTATLQADGKDICAIHALTDAGKIFYLSGGYWFQVPPLVDQKLMKLENGKPEVTQEVL